MSSKKTPWYGCPIRYGLGIWGDKWSLLIIRDLMFYEKRYYSDFTAPEEHMATNVLADRLKKLEAGGIIKKAKDKEKKSKIIYSLTEKGIDMLPIMLEIVDWSEKHDKKTKVPEEFIKGLRGNRKRFTAGLRKKLDEMYG